LLPLLAEKRQQVKDLGLWAPHLPEAIGGMGLSLLEFAHISEALGHSPLGHYTFNCQAPDVGNMEILHQFGTAEQQERFLQPLVEGRIRSCFSMTEPGHAGSNPVWMSTTAEKEGTDYLINGHKWFTSSADGAAFAIVMAVTNPEAESPYRRASQILVPLDTPGYIHTRRIPIMGEAGADYFSHSEVHYEDCRVPQSNLLGPEGGGFAIAQERLGPGRIHHCMRWIGICERALAMMCQRAAGRELSPGELLASRQTIQHWIGDSAAEIHASRLMVLDAAAKIDTLGQRAARVEISIIKFYVAGTLNRVLDRAIQLHGGLGMTDDTLLSHWYRHERAARIYDGPDEVHKSVVARQLLREYGVNISI
jgi:alkylation response protein AidB-like acyl-CoA dehydrogenase